MTEENPRRLPRGTQIYDAYNGARVGAIVGALLGAIVTWLTAPWMIWAIPVGAAACALGGYLLERRRIRNALAESGQPPE